MRDTRDHVALLNCARRASTVFSRSSKCLNPVTQILLSLPTCDHARTAVMTSDVSRIKCTRRKPVWTCRSASKTSRWCRHPAKQEQTVRVRRKELWLRAGLENREWRRARKRDDKLRRRNCAERREERKVCAKLRKTSRLQRQQQTT